MFFSYGPAPSADLAVKFMYQDGTLNGTKDKDLRNPSAFSILSHILRIRILGNQVVGCILSGTLF